MIQRPFLEADGGCQVYLLHPPGGVVGGDELNLRCDALDGAQALVTTPAATKLYRCPGKPSRQRQHFSIAQGSSMEWLPQETIVYNGAESHSELHADLTLGGQFTGWEIVCLGHDDEGFSRGRLTQRWQIVRNGKPLWSERADFASGQPVLTAPWGLSGRTVIGTLVSTGASPSDLSAVRRFADQQRDDDGDSAEGGGDDHNWLSSTLIGEVLVCRYLGYSAENAKRLLSGAWQALRPGVSGRQATIPRVWAT